MLYSYTTSLTASNAEFKKTCTAIENGVNGIQKGKLLVDVDGSMVQAYSVGGKTIEVFDDYNIDAVYVDSEVDLSGIIESKVLLER